MRPNTLYSLAAPTDCRFTLWSAFLWAFLFAFPAHAQIIEGPYGTQKFKEPAYEIADTAKLIAIYGHWMHDDVLDDDRYEDDLLEIGKRSSLYSCYARYRIDSLFNALYPKGATNMEYLATAVRIPNIKHSKYTFKNYKDTELTNKVEIGFNDYIYTETIPKIDWEITDTIANFKDLSCVKAKCHFRGKDWTAWFAPDIPVSDGPWKFHGLPGLIIYITDSEKTNVFSVLDLRYPKSTESTKPIKIYKSDKAFKITREKALRREHEVAMDPRLLNEEGFKGDTDIFGQRLFYAPLELE